MKSADEGEDQRGADLHEHRRDDHGARPAQVDELSADQPHEHRRDRVGGVEEAEAAHAEVLRERRQEGEDRPRAQAEAEHQPHVQSPQLAQAVAEHVDGRAARRARAAARPACARRTAVAATARRVENANSAPKPQWRTRNLAEERRERGRDEARRGRRCRAPSRGAPAARGPRRTGSSTRRRPRTRPRGARAAPPARESSSSR